MEGGGFLSLAGSWAVLTPAITSSGNLGKSPVCHHGTIGYARPRLKSRRRDGSTDFYFVPDAGEEADFLHVLGP